MSLKHKHALDISRPSKRGLRGSPSVPSKPFDLLTEARKFADTLSQLLNATVCNGVRLSAVTTPKGDALVGHRLTKTNLTPLKAFRLQKSCIFLALSYRLRADDEGDYLAVGSSFMGLFADELMEQTLLHFDYERDKGDGYPEAHLQVAAESPAWRKVLETCDSDADRKRSLEHLHLPVGGRLFRTLEDLIEFLITERLVKGKQGWQQALGTSRNQFSVKQMRALIRRFPAEAEAAVREFGA
jgi:hypothetical protein